MKMKTFLFSILILASMSAILGSVNVEFTLNLPMEQSTFEDTATTFAFRSAIATTANVNVAKVSVYSVTTTAMARRLLWLRKLLSVNINIEVVIQADDYQQASEIGILLDIDYINQDLNTQGLPSGTLIAGPTFANADYPMLTCVSCEEGQWLDDAADPPVCRECPTHSHTLPRVNAADISRCECEAGYTNATEIECSPCGLKHYKLDLGNATCSECPVNFNTIIDNADTFEHCQCEPGYYRNTIYYEIVAAGGLYYIAGDTTFSAPNPTLTVTRGRQTIIKWPENIQEGGNHPLIVSETSGWGGAAVSFAVKSQPTTTIDVPVDYVGTLYYYCQFHGGMKGVINVIDAACTDCEAGTYKPTISDARCTTCPDNSHSPATSDAESDCSCNLGYVGPSSLNTFPCAACVPGKFRSNPSLNICEDCGQNTYNELYAQNNVGACLSCPENTESDAGSGRKVDCVCSAGFSAALNAGGDAFVCTPCGTGEYQTLANSSTCLECEAGKYSTATAATSPSTCQTCADGEYNTATGASACVQCETGKWQNLGVNDRHALVCEDCPTHSDHGQLGSVDVNDCLCGPGYAKRTLEVNFHCISCPAGFYCPGGNQELTCPINTYSTGGQSECTSCSDFTEGISSSGLTGPDQCQCIEGTEGGPNTCTQCPPGTIQPLDYTHDSTQPVVRSDSDVAETVSCQACAAGKYNAHYGQTACVDCPANSNSLLQSDNVTDCTCNAKYYGPDGGPCALCEINHFCSGGLPEPEPCRSHSESPAGSESQADCDCKPGHYSLNDDSTCLKCPIDHYCPGDLAKTVCPTNSGSNPGSSSTSDCWCEHGHWRGCIQLQNGTGSLDQNGDPCDIQYDSACYECGPNDICFNETLLHCPPHSTSPAGSSSSDDCVCVDGFYNVDVH